METLIALVVALIVVALLYYVITIIPLPAQLRWLRAVLIVLLILALCVWLWQRFVQ